MVLKIFLKTIRKEPVDFAILGIIFSLMIFGFVWSAHDNSVQEKIIILTGTLYLFWGIIHHWHRGDLCLKIILEYLLLSLLGVTAVLFVILRR